MEYSGFARTWDRVVFRGDPASREFIAFWLTGDRVVAGMNVNVWDVIDPIQRLIRERVAVDDRRLADPDVAARGARPRRDRERGMNRLEQLHDAGVSIWLDTLSRELLDSGAFAALIADCAVTGATSNPTIFAKAITGSDRYDDQLRAAVASGVRDPQELFFELALDDVRRAADLLRPTYDASDGRDGFVSFECTPDLADDTAATIEQALELWGRLARPNVMIKVPATEAGIPAIEELTARGVNVNVTLLFSVARYEQVIDAYLAGLERRVAARAAGRRHRLGRLVLRLARRRQGRRPARRRLGAARPRRDRQRPPRLRPLPRALRRRALARAERRRRAPAATAVGQHRHQGPRLLRRALRRGADRPRRHQHHARGHPARLRRPRRRHACPQREHRRGRGDAPPAQDAGIDLAAITAQLEREGVQSFCDSYHELLDCIETKTEGSLMATERPDAVR